MKKVEKFVTYWALGWTVFTTIAVMFVLGWIFLEPYICK